MSELEKSVKACFYVVNEHTQFALRRMRYVPRIGEVCVFQETRFDIVAVEWCMDEDATEAGQRVNIVLKRRHNAS